MLWGLTGCSGSGASTVASVWRESGASVCSLDGVGHRFLDRTGIKEELAGTLGKPEYRVMSGEGIRKSLRETAFTDPGVIAAVNGILHPRLARWTAISAGLLMGRAGVFVLDAALVFELGLENILDFTVTVKDTRKRSLERLRTRDGIGGDAAAGRWLNQMGIEEKCLRSHFVIDNSGSLPDLKGKAFDFYKNVIIRMEDAVWHTRQGKN